MTNVAFSGNRSDLYGGAMYNFSSFGINNPKLTNVIFSANFAGASGGAIGNYCNYYGECSPILTNVVFSANVAVEDGGAIYNNGSEFGVSSPSLTNVTFSANKAARGGAMYSKGVEGNSNPILTNVILWGNKTYTDDIELCNISANPTIAFSLVEGGINGPGVWNLDSLIIDGGGNLEGGQDDDPLFVQPVSADDATTSAGDLRLLPGSPAIDAGRNEAVTLSTDLDNMPRIVDGNGDGIAVVDLGAYETPFSYELIVRYDGNGYGKVITNPTGGACESPCIGVYTQDTNVSLSAIADAGSYFAGWSGDVVGTVNPLAVVINNDVTLKARFDKAGSVRGSIVDQNNDPIDGATVILHSLIAVAGATQEQKTVTDASGSYYFDGLLPGSYTLSFLKLGYHISGPIAVQVSEDQTTDVNDVVMVWVGGDVYNSYLPAVRLSP